MSQTRLLFQNHLLALAIIVNAKKLIRSFQLARDLDRSQQKPLYLHQRIRAQMAEGTDDGRLSEVVDADETYIQAKAPCRKDGRGLAEPVIPGLKLPPKASP